LEQSTTKADLDKQTPEFPNAEERAASAVPKTSHFTDFEESGVEKQQIESEASKLSYMEGVTKQPATSEIMRCMS